MTFFEQTNDDEVNETFVEVTSKMGGEVKLTITLKDPLSLGSIELNLPLTRQQTYAMLDSSEGIDLELYQPLSTIDENLNQSNYEQLNLEEILNKVTPSKLSY
ncbi:hypothetical protein F8M41_020558 [Gigaspora margarita]|uniref:Uncharacterized protein n=1 Tax=Gigaspora margarita TaxID=4874 RepID=A0A8H4B1U6_GIGMA|nr:hypothetical protein F8M41_020558 [Gigaspora margarita]